MTTIALYNQGGVGKTASCVNFAYLAAADEVQDTVAGISTHRVLPSFYYK